MSLISKELAEEIERLLLQMNRGYWEELSWELQNDGAEFLVVVRLNEQQICRQNILVACAILRAVMATLLPSSQEGLTWVGALLFRGKQVGSVCGGLKDDWRTLGTHGGLDADVLWEE